MNAEKINNRYATGVFVNNPQIESEISIVLDKMVNEYLDVFFSIVIPVHNQESIIVKNIESILINTTGHNYELIIILFQKYNFKIKNWTYFVTYRY